MIPLFRHSMLLSNANCGRLCTLYPDWCNSFRGPKHVLFHSLIWAHSTAIFPMKFHTHHQKVIPNQEQQSHIVYYVPLRRCMTLNFELIFIIFPYYVFIEAWRINICTRLESGEPPDDYYVRNLQQNHSFWGHESENAFMDICAQWSVKS